MKTIKVTEKEFHITLSTRKGAVGPVRFVIKNTGKYTHGLAISGPGVKLKKSALIKPGKSATLAVTLKSGHLHALVPGARPCREGHEDLDHGARHHDGRRWQRRLAVDGGPTTTSDTTTGGEAWG